jgi:hypothetical protein
MVHNHLHLYKFLLPEGHMGEVCKSSKLRWSFGNRVELNRKGLSLLTIERINVVYSVLNINWLSIQNRPNFVASSVRMNIKCSEQFHENSVFVYCNRRVHFRVISESDGQLHFHASPRSEGASYKRDFSLEIAANYFCHLSCANSHYMCSVPSLLFAQPLTQGSDKFAA